MNTMMSRKIQELVQLLDENESLIHQLDLMCKQLNMIRRIERDKLVLRELLK